MSQPIGVGDLAATDDPDLSFTTVLGSCIAVGLWDQSIRVGGLNHFLLATVQGEAPQDLRYGEVAIPALISRLQTLGAETQRLKAVVVGGANVIRARVAIGTENALFANNWLADHGISVVKSETGGRHARRFTFAPGRSSYKISTIADAADSFD
ncbi:MAG: chemotaxis protein CheD [Pseudomonadota bacterium]